MDTTPRCFVCLMHVADDTFKCAHCPRLYCSTKCKTIDHTKWKHAEYCPNLTPPTIMTDVVEPLMDFFTASTELPPDASDEEVQEVLQQGKDAHESSSKWMHEMKHTLFKLFQHHPAPLKAIQLYFDNIKDLNERTSRLVRRVAQDETLSEPDQQAMFGKIVTDSNAISAFYTEILEVQMDQALNTSEFQEYGLPDAPLGLNLIFRRVHVKVAMKKGLETVLDDRSPSSVTVEELAGMKLGVNCDPTANPDGVELRAFVESGLRRSHVINGYDEPAWAVLESFGKLEEIWKAWKLREWAINAIAKKLEIFFNKWESFKPHSKKPDDAKYNPRCVYQKWANITDPSKKAEFADEALIEMFERFPHLALYKDPSWVELIDILLTTARLGLATRLGIVDVHPIEEVVRSFLLPIPRLMMWLGGSKREVSLRELDFAKDVAKNSSTVFNNLNTLIPGHIRTVTYNPDGNYSFGGIIIAPAFGRNVPNTITGNQSQALYALEAFIIGTGTADEKAKNNMDWHSFYNTTMALEKTPEDKIYKEFDLTSSDKTIQGNSVAAVIQSIASMFATDPADLRPIFSSPVRVTRKSSGMELLRAATAAVVTSPQLLMHRIEGLLSMGALVMTLAGIFVYGDPDMGYGTEILRNIATAIYFTDWFFRFVNLFSPSGKAPHAFELVVSDDARRIVIANDEIEFEHVDPDLLEHLRANGVFHWVNTTIAGGLRRPSVSTSSGKTYYGTISRSASTAMVQGINMLRNRHRGFMAKNLIKIFGTDDAQFLLISSYYLFAGVAQLYHWTSYWCQKDAVSTIGTNALNVASTLGQVAIMASDNKALQNLVYVTKLNEVFGGLVMSNAPSGANSLLLLVSIGYPIVTNGWTIGTTLFKNCMKNKKKEEERRRERSSSHPPPREETRRIEEATQQELQQTDGAYRLKIVSRIVKAGMLAIAYWAIQAYVGSPQPLIGEQPVARKWVETKKK